MSAEASRNRNESGEGYPPQPTGSPSATPWWHLLSERLESELRELDAAGIPYEKDTTAEVAGVLRLHLRPTVDGVEIPLSATFPDNYPYFAFSVEAPTLDLAHHQHPIGKSLCLLPRGTSWWRPESDRLAHFLRDRLQLVLDAGSTEDVAAAAPIEEHAPEPFSDYYGYERDAIVLVAAGDDGRARVPAHVSAGAIMLGVEDVTPDAAVPALLRGALLEVRDDAGAVVLRAPEALAARYRRRIQGRWSRVGVAVKPTSFDAAAKEVYEAGAEADTHRSHPPSVATQDGRTIRVRAVLFPEERRWRGESNAIGDGWVFVIRLQTSGPTQMRARVGGKHARHQLRGAPASPAAAAPVHYLARAWRYAPGDLAARAPELVPLRPHTVALFGLGCVGAPSAFEFARASVGKLRLLDHDAVDPATTMRWPLGAIVAGRLKAPTLAQILAMNYPYVQVSHEQHRIGAPRSISADGSSEIESEAAVIARMLDGAALVYDATAEWGVQRFLAEAARARGIPYIGVEGSPGGWGGMVVRIVPGETEGCWLCLQHWRHENPEKGGVRPPPHDAKRGDVHPEGCADPTYTGANFDLMEVALMGVRTATGTLSAGTECAYPCPSWDVAVLELRDADGSLLAPRWTTHRLMRHPACRECARRE